MSERSYRSLLGGCQRIPKTDQASIFLLPNFLSRVPYALMNNTRSSGENQAFTILGSPSMTGWRVEKLLQRELLREVERLIQGGDVVNAFQGKRPYRVAPVAQADEAGNRLSWHYLTWIDLPGGLFPVEAAL